MSSLLLLYPFTVTGKLVLALTDQAGRVSLFFWRIMLQLFRPPFYFRECLKQCEKVGVNSIPIVLLTALFTGGVLALQTYRGFSSDTLAEETVGTVVALSMLRELGPVLASLMVAGRVGASIAAEIGTMRVTEQIDALVTLATNPIKYLVLPRVLAITLMMPLLVTLANVVGIFGGFIVATKLLGISPNGYFEKSFSTVVASDISLGLIKAAIFGFIIGLISCYQGFNTRGGAEGVGKATTTAVVVSSVLVLVSDYFITALLFKN